MKVDISDILRVNGASLKLEFEEAPSGFEDLSEEYKINSQVRFSGLLTNINGRLVLEGKLNTGYEVKCFRCLKVIEGQMEIKVNESFAAADSANDDVDAYSFTGKRLDLDRAIQDNIILNLPMKQLCSDECKGLCSNCGADLNETECACREDTVNPQMELLKKFFNN